MPPIGPLTKSLVLICVGLFCLQLVAPPELERWLALWPWASGNFMPWQVLSYGFLHGDLWHLLFNMLGLWMFGSELERIWGPRRYLQFLLASLLAAALVQIMWTHWVGTRVPTVGASGALFGLLLAYGMTFPNRMIMLIIPPIPMKAKYFVWLYAAVEIYFGLQGRDGIAHFAHLGGMVGGYLMLSYWRGQGPFKRRR
jgi:membrane associated rhomboid family serine protease